MELRLTMIEGKFLISRREKVAMIFKKISFLRCLNLFRNETYENGIGQAPLSVIIFMFHKSARRHHDILYLFSMLQQFLYLLLCCILIFKNFYKGYFKNRFDDHLIGDG